MKTIPFQDVLHDVAGLLGLEPEDSDASNFDRFQAASITRHINRHVRRAWEYFEWPEFEPIEQRYFRDTWSMQAYPVGAEVYHAASDTYYRALTPSPPPSEPSAGTEWEVLTDFARYIELSQAGLTEIAEAVCVTDLDPTTNDFPKEIPFTTGIHGIHLPASITGTSVWLRYRTAPTTYTSTPWTAQNYAAGARVYHAGTGECYTARTSATQSDIPGTADLWVLTPFPYVLSPYVVQAAYADALREDGQHERARAELGIAREYLDDAMAKVVVTQGHTARYAIVTARTSTSRTTTTSGGSTTPTTGAVTFDSTTTTFDSTTVTFDAA